MTELIRNATASDVAAIKTIAVETEMFAAEDVGFFDDMVGGFLDGSMEDNHWLVAEDDDEVVAGAYFAPEPFADRMWNVYFISVTPRAHGRGVGGRLLDHIERLLAAYGSDRARTLIIETSSTDQYARTRDFYRFRGYDEEARVREFYGPGDHKVVFWKSLVDETS